MKIANKKAYFDYQITDHFEAGINLLGSEVKAIRLGHADLSGSFVRIIGNEAYLVNAKIFPYKYAIPEGYDENRTRKLLLHKKEIVSLKSKVEGKSLALVPLSLYMKDDYIKLGIGLGKSKKAFEKRASIKAKDVKRDIEQEINS